MWTRTILCCALLALCGCLSQRSPSAVRWFLPQVPEFEPEVAATSGIVLLQPVQASPHLGRPMVWRLSAVEILFDELAQWGAEPEALVEETLSEALFVSGPFRRAARGAAGTVALTVELRAFEGVLDGELVARAEVVVQARAEGTEETRRFSASARMETRDAEALAEAMGEVLHALARDVRSYIAERLSS